MRIVQFPVSVLIQRGWIVLIMFPFPISFFHQFKQMDVIRAMFVQPDTELPVNFIDMKTVGIFEIKKSCTSDLFP